MKLAGKWIDETRAYSARQRGDDFDPDLYSVNEVLELTALPCWRHLRPDHYRQRIEEMIDGIERVY